MEKKIYRRPFSFSSSIRVFLNLHVIPLPIRIFVLFYIRFFFFDVDHF